MPIDDELVAFLHQHVVPVFFTLEKGQDTEHRVMTTFVLSVSNRWFLITAGHCVQQVETRTKRDGYGIVQCLLMDSLGLGATYREPIPFVYEQAQPVCLSDDLGFDYGVIDLSPHYKQLLQANNVRGLNEEVWKKQPGEVDFYGLLGIPTELIKLESEGIWVTPVPLIVDRISQKPKGFTKVNADLFYGRIVLPNGMTSIEGMSGGPVFAFHRNENGETRYWLTALQSQWLPNSHYIEACPTRLLGHFLEELVMR